MTPPSTLRSLQQVLREAPGAAAWQASLQTQETLRRTLADSIPAGLAALCQIALDDSGEVLVTCPSGTLAARVRQALPRLTAQLATAGHKVRAIRVAVQAPGTGPVSATGVAGPPPVREARHAPEGAAEAVQTLAGQLPPGDLADALGRLARHLAAQTAAAGPAPAARVSPAPAAPAGQTPAAGRPGR